MGIFGKGYVLPEGKLNEKVPETVTIYASPALHSVIRRGKTSEVNFKGVNRETYTQKLQSFKDAREEAKKIMLDAQKNASKKFKVLSPLSKKVSLAVDSDAVVDIMAKEMFSESLAEYMDYFNSNSLELDEVEVDDLVPEVDNDHDGTDIVSKYIDKLVENSFTKTGIKQKLANTAAKTELMLEMSYRPLEVLADITNTASDFIKEVPIAKLSKYFDDMEDMIDALPTMSEIGEDVYIVEYKEINGEKDWYYTGEHEPADRAANARIQAAKAQVCAWLADKMANISAKMNNFLEEQLNRIEKCRPFTIAIEIIKSIPSLTTIIKWAKAAIDFFVGTYKLIFNIIKTAMEALELVIIRGPQLINKVMKKITEFNCPIQFNVSVNTSNITNAVKDAAKGDDA